MDKRSVALFELLQKYADGNKTASEIAHLVGRSVNHTRQALVRFGLPFSQGKKGFANQNVQKKARSPENMAIVEHIRRIADGTLSSKEIASIVGTTSKYVQSILLQYDLPRLSQGAQLGENNPAYIHGRRIDLDGYVLIRAPKDHPFARSRKGRNYGIIYEHRLVAEQKLGRFLQPAEVVDHIDGLHLHNHPDNLRVFPSNADHLRATITGNTPNWSQAGLEKMKTTLDQREGCQCVDTYSEKRKCGDVRLQQILLAWLQLGKDSPYLLGSRHWLEKAGISDFHDSSLQQHLQKIFLKWGGTLRL